ncbi:MULTISPECIES: hypothetical protein [unclassified Isoptericola]|uniref:hypothetical protein n=1 Tax=Isoptericola sp. NPDC057191 TaxID=3346041 RepID=UPI0036413D49
MEASVPRWRVVVSYGFPLLVLAALPYLAWAILPFPAVAAQWTVGPLRRRAVTITYVCAVVASALFTLVSQALVGGQDISQVN